MTEDQQQPIEKPEAQGDGPGEELVPEAAATPGAVPVHKMHTEKFLKLLRLGASVGDAARSVGVCRRTAYNRRAEDAAFAAAWDDAVEEGTDRAETALARCAMKAMEDPKYQTSLIFLLKNRRPQQWRDVHDLRHSGAVALPVVLKLLPEAEPPEARPLALESLPPAGPEAKPL